MKFTTIDGILDPDVSADFNVNDLGAYAMRVARESMVAGAYQRFIHAPIVERQAARIVYEMVQTDSMWYELPGRLAVLEVPGNGAIAAWGAYEFLRPVQSEMYVWWNTKLGRVVTTCPQQHIFHDLRCYDVDTYRLHTYKMFHDIRKYMPYV